MNSVLQYVLYVGILVVFAIPLGFYMSKVMDGEKTIVSRVLGPVEGASASSCVLTLRRIWAGRSIWPPRFSLIYSAL